MGRRISFLKKRIFSAVRKRVLGKFAKGVIYDTANGRLAAPLEDVSIGKTLGFKGAYDGPAIEALAKLLRKDDVLYVIGTHIGALFVPLAKSCREVIGYEANPETYQFACTNTQLNGLHNVRIFNLAAGDSARKIEFYQSRCNSGGSKIKPLNDSYLYNYDSPATIEVEMVSIDAHASVERLPDPCGIIVDIEGAEYLALKGMQSALAKTRFLYIEFVPHHLDNVAGVSNADFFEQILRHFSTVRFMHNHAATIDLKKGVGDFREFVDDFRLRGVSDDLLFMKDG